MSSFYSVLTNQSSDVQNNTLVLEIENHLTALLNARQCMMSARHDYGLPDICAEYTKAYPAHVISATRDLITRFEPRLKIKKIICNDLIRYGSQLKITVIAALQDSSIIELTAMVGAQRFGSVKVA
jgi:predicted component of type VI protein secretion system